ncbi:MAG TPA: FAD-dependent oxidoreductase [bacterium]|nr:FAD-dependent oxidoreductase [bacterium]
MAAGDAAPPLRVAIFGSGPAGFYATEDLLKQQAQPAQVDLFDRLPTPYGLVRGGVAPDHQNIKVVIKIYERAAGRPGFRFFGNVRFGEHLNLQEVLAHYHMALFCTGAESDRRMGIPGEDLPGSYPATELVGWYNGHPDYRHLTFDLSRPRVAVIGNGNVAMDVARILAKPQQELASTDIADYALAALAQSGIQEIFLLGRRGPAQAAFTNPEIRELAEIPGVDLVVRPEELELDAPSQAFLASVKEPTYQRNVDILRKQIPKGTGTQPRKIWARFFVSPVALLGEGRVQAIRLEKNKLVQDESGSVKAVGTGQHEDLPVDLVFRSIGYKGLGLPGLPYDAKSGIVPNHDGRVVDPASGQPVPRLYVAGWIKRGPSGVIGTNKPDAAETVARMLEDAKSLALPTGLNPDPAAMPTLLASKGVRVVTFGDWKKLDQLEVAAGKAHGKPREKFTTVQAMLAALG